jgi:HEAT repeat protein
MTESTFPIPPSGALPAEAALLVARLADADAAVRRIALLALADLEDPNLLQPLAGALAHDPSADVRREAAHALGSWEADWTVEALCHALLDTDHDVRAAAAQSLSMLKDVSSGPIMLRWAQHPEPFVQGAAWRGLRALRYAEAFAPALHALEHPEAHVRVEVVGVLGWLKDLRAAEPLAALATADADPDVRRAAAGALGFAAKAPDGQPAVAAALLVALRDPTWQVREEAATTLGKLRAGSARDALVEALDDAYWQVRLRAVRALGQLRDPAAAAPVAALLAHPIGNLRKEAALALGELDDGRSLTALRAALDDGDPEVRKAVRIALTQIEARNT